MSLLDDVSPAQRKKQKKKAPAKKKAVPSGGDLPTGPSMERYAHSAVKQISLHFTGTEYREVIARLRRVLADGKFDSHCEAFLAMLTLWEKEHGLDEATS